MAYLVYCALNMAYIETPTPMETSKQSARRLYSTIHEMDRAGRATQEMRIVQKNSKINWNRVWRNLTKLLDIGRQKIRMVFSHTRYCTNKWTIIRYTPGRHSILSSVRHARHDTIPFNRMRQWDGDLGMDSAPNGNDTNSRSEVHSKWLAPNAVFPFLTTKMTASNNVDPSSSCLVQNARAAATNTNGLHRLYATLKLEDAHTHTHRTSGKSGELPQHTLGAVYYKGLHKGATRYLADECQTVLVPHPRYDRNTNQPDSNRTITQR
jgi:hypothetical protein